MLYKAPKLRDYVVFNDRKLDRQYANKKIPMVTLVEAYLDGRIDIPGDIEELLEHRESLVSFVFTDDHVKFVVKKFIPEVTLHSQEQDVRVAQDHYDRGNDYFGAFLGHRMIYTSAFFTNVNQTLEEAQDQKLNLVCQKLQLQPGETLLDIGCGWGSLAIHAAKHYGARSTGVTAAEEQTKFALDRAREMGVADRVEIRCHDYREIPQTRYSKISCLEMAEHVGVRRFQKFMRQVFDLLDDDGIYLQQVAGLRRAFQMEDLVWGLFMNKHIFPGADASTPLTFYVGQLEKAGFEVHSVENIGIHYSHTLHRWYLNWMSNRDEMTRAYGDRYFRLWRIFLAWSTRIARQGSATCYQLVAHKNINSFNRNRFIGTPQLGEQTAAANLLAKRFDS